MPCHHCILRVMYVQGYCHCVLRSNCIKDAASYIILYVSVIPFSSMGFYLVINIFSTCVICISVLYAMRNKSY